MHGLHDLHRAMVITMPVMHMVQATVHQVIHVVTMRYHFMSAVFSMLASARGWLVFGRVCIAYRYAAFVPMSVVLVVQMAVVHIVNVVFVLDFRMPACNAMLMCVFPFNRMVLVWMVHGSFV